MSDDKSTKKIRDRHIQIRLTDTEFNDIKTRAGELGTSTFLRQLALGQNIEQPKGKAKKIIHAADPELVRHVAWIGNNINQIAKAINTDIASSRPLDAARLLHLLIGIDQTLRELKK